MPRWSPAREGALEALAAEILTHYAKGRGAVAGDGAEGSGSREFATDLAAVLVRRGHAAEVAHVDDFQRPRAERGEATPEGRYRDAFDYSVLRRVLIDPFRLGGSAAFVLAAFDADADQPLEPTWTTAPASTILLVEGEYLLRSDLRSIWNFSIWLDGQGEPLAKYVADAEPRTRASAIVDNSDPESPRRVFADSC